MTSVKRRKVIAGCIIAVMLLLPSRLQSPIAEEFLPSGKALSFFWADGPISRYDTIIKKYAANIGWDWRLLAAVIYNESRFHNEASSHKGAVGLMQVLSPRYTNEELLIPERNIEIGSAYLKKLEGMYGNLDREERLKFVLASYNAGEGKIRSYIRQAARKGLDTTSWEQVSTMLPRRHHTKAYVKSVIDTYTRYRSMYPPSQP